MHRVLIINGPNLNLLGLREPEVYGSTTLEELDGMVVATGRALGLDVSTFQSNHEGAIIDRLHQARDEVDGLVINAGAFSHYSYAIHDALLAAALPAVEVHISNINAREPWRRTSVTAPACTYALFGRGVDGYRDAMIRLITTSVHPPLRVAYGDAPDQYGEIRLPDGAGPHPVAVLIHGGFWRDPYRLDLMDRLAIDLARRGWAAWNVEYRRVGAGGGIPATVDDVTRAIDAIPRVHPMFDSDRVAVIGHSAGGHLALLADRLAGDAVAPRAVVSLAGVSDLQSAYAKNLGNGAVSNFLGHPSPPTDAELLDHSPAHRPAPPPPTLLVHGTADDRVPLRQSVDMDQQLQILGADSHLIEVPGADHFAPLDPASEAWRLTMRWLDGLLTTWDE
jgi:3-dehydroquinate dehydratase type II